MIYSLVSHAPVVWEIDVCLEATNLLLNKRQHIDG